MKTFLKYLSVLSAWALGAFVVAANAADVSSVKVRKPSIVLVHGAFADASAWQRVTPLLEREGYTVTAVEQPLTSLSGDVAVTKRAIEAQKGPVVLVGHSYGGAVISEAATGYDQVKALVYIAAFAPEPGEALGPMQQGFAAPPLATALVADAAGFVSVDHAKFHEVVAADLPVSLTDAVAVNQRPIFGGSFATPITSAAWKTIPSWYVVATEDRAINPDFERFMARRIHTTTTEVKSSHVPFLSQPQAIADVILQAARSVAKIIPPRARRKHPSPLGAHRARLRWANRRTHARRHSRQHYLSDSSVLK